MTKLSFLALFVLSAISMAGCGTPAAPRPAVSVNEKIGLYVTPPGMNTPHFPVGYAQAVKTLKGYARTVWVLESWRDIEVADGQYDWASLDQRIDEAVTNGFDVGIRAQIVLCGNNAKKEFVAISRVPTFVGDMSSAGFAAKAQRFYGALAQRYKGKARYIAVGNSVNKYFDRNPTEWEGFKKAYPGIVRTIHAADPKVIVLSDLVCGGEYYQDKDKLQKYLDFFGQSEDDGFGFILYFITKVFYGGFANFNQARLSEVLDELHARCGSKNIYLIETSCFSRNPNTGKDMSAVQAQYVDMLIRMAVAKDYIIGLSWWQLYDARDAPGVPWDVKASFGLFDSAGKPKPAWATWQQLCTLRKSP